MFVKKPSFWLTSLAGVFLLSSLLAVNVHAQETGSSNLTDSKVSNFTDSKVAELPYVLPNLYKRHLVSTFSVSQVGENVRADEDVYSRDTYTEASASFAYNLQRKHSEYVVDYRGAGRHYNRFRDLDGFTHDLGLSQVVHLTPRLKWILNNRFSFSPDFTGMLVRENLARDASFSNPFSQGGVGNISALVNPFPEFHSVVDGLDSNLRLERMTNSTTGNLIHQLSARTSLSIQGGYRRERFSESVLFESNIYTVSAGLSRLLTPRTSIGLNYLTGRFDYSGSFGRTINQAVGMSINHQLTPSTMVNFSVQPSWITTNGQATIALSPVLANLLGRHSLSQNTSQSHRYWGGAAGLAKRWRSVNIGLDYNRSVSSTNGIAGSATREMFGAVRRQIMLDTEHKKIRWRSGSSGLMLGCPSFEVQPFS